MARADLLINLVKAANTGDRTLFRKTVEALIAEERAKHHHTLADRLAENINGNGNLSPPSLTTAASQVQNLLFETTPRKTLDNLILPDVVIAACKELVEEQHRYELLRSYNLEPRHRILLAGPPGNGKTTLAEALAEAIMVPMIVVRYEGIIGSYLGETSQRLKRLFEYVSTRRCLLFFDEFDTLGKERGDIHETGEIKRVVSSLLLQMDALPSHVIVVTASNHPELLDRAVWRRFQVRLHLPPPAVVEIEEWFLRFEKRLGKPLAIAPRTLAQSLKGLSFAEVEDFGLDIQRRFVLSQGEANIKNIVADRLKQWKSRFTPNMKSR